MKVGIYTPTHRPSSLGVTAASVVSATWLANLDAEVVWLISVNKAPASELPKLRPVDGLTYVIDESYSGEPGNIGALKHHCCARLLEMQCSHLVELDHDDELTPDALRALLAEFRNGADFVCSDTASAQRYPAEFGWQSESAEVNGRRGWVHRTPDICARSLVDIFYAPNHVRAWSAEIYKRSDGYNTKLAVCDDHDLLCRTYIAGADMRVLHRPLYYQHSSPLQTQVERNAEIQQQQHEVGTSHLYALAQEQARRSGRMMIDLGGAIGKPPGYYSIDVRAGADFRCDVRKGLPFGDGSIEVVRAHDFLEHVQAGTSVIELMNEIWRVLAPGGWLLTSTPSTDGRGAYQDPTHVSFWNSNSWWYYTQAEFASYITGLRCRFQSVRVRNHSPSPFHLLHNIVYCDAALWCLKGQPSIGRNLI